jgi:hypothetical protein
MTEANTISAVSSQQTPTLPFGSFRKHVIATEFNYLVILPRLALSGFWVIQR